MNVNEEANKFFETVYAETYSLLVRIAFRITGGMDSAEELCQDAYIKFYERIETIPDVTQAKYWLIRVVKNMSLNHEKRRGRQKKAYDRFLNEPKRELANSGEHNILKEESKKIVQDALLELPHKLRVVLVLKEYGGFNYKEIGSMMNISEGNVKVRIFRAREKLAEVLQKGEVYVP